MTGCTLQYKALRCLAWCVHFDLAKEMVVAALEPIVPASRSETSNGHCRSE
jgi:hypothetical protein